MPSGRPALAKLRALQGAGAHVEFLDQAQLGVGVAGLLSGTVRGPVEQGNPYTEPSPGRGRTWPQGHHLLTWGSVLGPQVHGWGGDPRLDALSRDRDPAGPS